MIEVNLIRQKEPFKVPIILGMDLNAINWKGLGIVFLLSFAPEWFVRPHFDGQKSEVQTEIDAQTAKLNKLRKENSKYKDIDKQLEAFNRRVEELKNKSSQVEKIVKSKSNPKKLLEFLSKETPRDMWFNHLIINPDNSIKLEGGSSSYKSIGAFLVAARSSSYFRNSLDLTSSNTIEENTGEGVVRIESYVIDGKVISFDPFKM